MLHLMLDEDVYDMESLEQDYPDEDDIHNYVMPLPTYPQYFLCTSPTPRDCNAKPHTPLVDMCRYNDTCAICLDTIQYLDTGGRKGKQYHPHVVYCQYQCGQVFHTTCLHRWHQNTCPTCRHTQKPSGRVPRT